MARFPVPPTVLELPPLMTRIAARAGGNATGWKPAAVVSSQHDGADVVCSKEIVGGNGVIPGTFHATNIGDTVSGFWQPRRLELRCYARFQAANSDPDSAPTEKTMSQIKLTHPGCQRCDDIGFEVYPVARQAGSLRWGRLSAAWSLRGAALLSRGARSNPVVWDGSYAG